jgi:hypothetical protein
MSTIVQRIVTIRNSRRCRAAAGFDELPEPVLFRDPLDDPLDGQADRFGIRFDPQHAFGPADAGFRQSSVSFGAQQK